MVTLTLVLILVGWFVVPISLWVAAFAVCDWWRRRQMMRRRRRMADVLGRKRAGS